MYSSTILYHCSDFRTHGPIKNLDVNKAFVGICSTPRDAEEMDDAVLANVKAMLRDHGDDICPQNGLEPACLANRLDVVKYLLELEYKVSMNDGITIDEDKRRVEGSIHILQTVCKLGYADVAIALMEMCEKPVQPDMECLELSCAFLASDKCGSECMQRCVLKILSLGIFKFIRAAEIVFRTRCTPLIMRLLEYYDANMFRMDQGRNWILNQLHRNICSWAADIDISILRIVAEKFGFPNSAVWAERASATGNVEMFKLVWENSYLTNMDACILIAAENGHMDLLEEMLTMIDTDVPAITFLHAFYSAEENVAIFIKDLLKTHMIRRVLEQYQSLFAGCASGTGNVRMFKMALDKYISVFAKIASATCDIEMFKMVRQHLDLTNMIACIVIASGKGYLDLLKEMLTVVASDRYQYSAGPLLHAFYSADIDNSNIRELVEAHMDCNKNGGIQYNISENDVHVAMKIGMQSVV